MKLETKHSAFNGDQALKEIDILSGLKTRDLEAFNVLFDSLFGKVRYYTEQITKDQFEAEDIAMRSITTFWEQELSQYDTMKRVNNFIFNVARNSAFDYLRKKKVKENYQSNIVAYITEEHADYLMERRCEVELLRYLYHEIDKLPQRTRQAFKMIYVHQMSSREAGQQLNISEVTVRRLCSEARKKLRNKFSGKEFINCNFSDKPIRVCVN